MRHFFKIKSGVTSLAALSAVAIAQPEISENFRMAGVDQVIIPIETHLYNSSTNSLSLEGMIGIKTIKLMSIIPSQKMLDQNKAALQTLLATGGEKDYRRGIIPFQKSRGAIDLGMANVPVLDQGADGTCVTFATTAALDAKLKKGDYIDQQCSLALNKYLGNDYWHGAYNATQILVPLKKYGIIAKGSCFGSKYPNSSQKISPGIYQTKSNTSFSNSILYSYSGTANLDIVKSALRKGYRLAIGTSLSSTGDPISVSGFNMTVNGKQTLGGLWACQQPGNTENYCAKQRSGHEVIIIGYDDKQQLLKIRNSWGNKVGDNGDFYMTYSFFNAMVSDHTEIR
jgi:hypothetical protein